MRGELIQETEMLNVDSGVTINVGEGVAYDPTDRTKGINPTSESQMLAGVALITVTGNADGKTKVRIAKSGQVLVKVDAAVTLGAQIGLAADNKRFTTLTPSLGGGTLKNIRGEILDSAGAVADQLALAKLTGFRVPVETA